MTWRRWARRGCMARPGLGRLSLGFDGAGTVPSRLRMAGNRTWPALGAGVREEVPGRLDTVLVWWACSMDRPARQAGCAHIVLALLMGRAGRTCSRGGLHEQEIC